MAVIITSVLGKFIIMFTSQDNYFLNKIIKVLFNKLTCKHRECNPLFFPNFATEYFCSRSMTPNSKAIEKEET